MKIAVTAASGHLGAAVVKALIDRVGASSVVALARRVERAAAPGVEVRLAATTNPRR